MKKHELGFEHVVQIRDASPYTLLLLHGTGGNERDLLPLAEMLNPQASVISPRGKVLENGMPRFFRRLAEGVLDQEDLAVRTKELAAFVGQAIDAYGLNGQKIIAAGYSNGANIAANILLHQPGILDGAILYHVMVPSEKENPSELHGVRVFMSGGRHDPMVPPGHTERLAGMLREAGAVVRLEWQPGGHQLSAEEVAQSKKWLQETFGA